MKRAAALADTSITVSELDAAIEHLRDLKTGDLSGRTAAGYIDFYDDAFAFLALTLEIQRRYEDAPVESARREIARALADASDRDLVEAADRLTDAGEELYGLVRLVRRADKIEEYIREVEEPSYGRTQDELLEVVETAVTQRDGQRLDEARSSLVSVAEGTWTQADLLSCTHREFEVLVADLWRQGGFDARTTKFVQDFNIDVIVERDDGGVDLIQAKQQSPGNKVGVSVVQRTAGLLLEFDADEVYVVTSSTFTENARESASRMKESVTLVDERNLRVLLDESSLLPPF